MVNKTLVKVAPTVAALLLLTVLAMPVSATGAHLWFYSVDPATIGYPPLPNPEGLDPNYVGAHPDPWLTESIVVPQGDWDTPFSIWIGNADPHDDCYGTRLVISLNDAAYAAIADISVTPALAWGTWSTDPDDFPLPPHGVSNSAEWAGFIEVTVGGIPSGEYIEIIIDLTLNPDPNLEEAKIHFDAYGWSNPDMVGDPDITNPFSHDYTFVIPEVATVFLTTGSLAAFGAYAYKRKRCP